MKHLYDKDGSFKYTPAVATDIRKRFDEERAKLKAELKRSEELAKKAEQIVAKTRIGKTCSER